MRDEKSENFFYYWSEIDWLDDFNSQPVVVPSEQTYYVLT